MRMNRQNILYLLGTLFIIAGTIMYVFSTVDLIPDTIIFFGFIDDAALVILAYLLILRLRRNLRRRKK